MCIVCNGRFNQSDLYRFKCINGKVTKYDRMGRSFYICKNCINASENIIKKKLAKVCKNPTTLPKEMNFNVS